MTDSIITAARFLSDQMRRLRSALDEQGQPYAPHVFREIAQCERRMRAIVEGPAAKKYLGPCGADVPRGETDRLILEYGGNEEIGWEVITVPCEGDVHARVYATGRVADSGRCDTCGATVDTAERTAWLDDEVRQWAYRASEIEDAYGISANLIRQWATPARDLVQVHGHDREGRALYLLSQVLDVARDMAKRRAERQAEKARRTAARAAERERMSA